MPDFYEDLFEGWRQFLRAWTLPALSAGLAAALILPVLLLSGCAPIEPPAEATDETIEAGDADDPLEYPEWETLAPGENALYNQRASLLQRGKIVYDKYCVGCHGEYGDGKGPAAVRLITQPRDFTSGIYKFRSTDSGSLPLESDLDRTITRGLARVSMPAFPLMPEREKVALIEYVKAFYPDWDAQKDGRRIVPVPFPPDDLLTASRVERGQVVYLQMGCWKCHGSDGRGKGATQTEYVDAWGNTQKPFDFTRGSLKGGDSPEDIYRTFHTGLRSIMPAYSGDTLAAVAADGFEAAVPSLDPNEAEALRPIFEQFPADSAAIFSDMDERDRLDLATRNSWDLVAYVISLRSPISTAEAVLGPAAATLTESPTDSEESSE